MTVIARPRLVNRPLFWAGMLALCAGFLWIFNDILTPFVLGAAIAYLLDPPMARLCRLGLPRWAAALTILGLFFAVVAAALAVGIPVLHRELLQFAEKVPDYLARLQDLAAPWAEKLHHYIDAGDLQKAAQGNIDNAFRIGGGLLGKIAGGGQALAGFAATAALAPVASFFLMKEWPKVKAWVHDLLPRDSRDTINGLAQQIDMKISGYIRGQSSVALCLAAIYALALTLAGLDFGFLIGIVAGLLSFVPYLGSTGGLLASVLVSWFQKGDPVYSGMIAAVFLIGGQVLETYVLTPRLVGKSVGLHPLWILFALMAGGSLFGLTGMLLAVPAAASVSVLASFALARYRESDYYRGSAT